jgi:hypothetical protein
MKKLIIIAAGLITMHSCTKGGGTTTPATPTTPTTTGSVNKFNITFNGKTYNLTGTETMSLTNGVFVGYFSEY